MNQSIEEKMGVQLSWESTCFASRGSSVRSRSSPPLPKGRGNKSERHTEITTWAHSSGGQSARLISVRSVVRVHLSPPLFGYFPFFRSPRITIRVAHEENENYLKKKITDESLLEKRMQFDTKVKNNIPPQKSKQNTEKEIGNYNYSFFAIH